MLIGRESRQSQARSKSQQQEEDGCSKEKGSRATQEGAERLEAERKRKAEEEKKRKSAIEAARKKRLEDRIEESKSGIRKCVGEAKELGRRFQKCSMTVNLLPARSTCLPSNRPKTNRSPPESALLRSRNNSKPRPRICRGPFWRSRGSRIPEKKTQSKGGSTETWEKILLELKRDLSSANATVKSGESQNKNYARLLLSLVPEFVRAPVFRAGKSGDQKTVFPLGFYS